MMMVIIIAINCIIVSIIIIITIIIIIIIITIIFIIIIIITIIFIIAHSSLFSTGQSSDILIADDTIGHLVQVQ